MEIEAGDLAIKNIHADDEASEYYSLDGSHSPSPRKGMNIIRCKNGRVRKVLIKNKVEVNAKGRNGA